MKKALAILGLLVCTTGVVFADEVADVQAQVPQEVEIQSQLDKQTFDRDKNKFNQNPKFNSELKKGDSNIKYDKSVKNQKFNTKRPQIYGKKFDKQDIKANKPFLKNDKKADLFKYQKPNHKMGYYKGYHNIHRHHRPNQNMRMHRYDNHRMINRRAYNRPIKRK